MAGGRRQKKERYSPLLSVTERYSDRVSFWSGLVGIAPVWSGLVWIGNRDLPPKIFYASERFDLVRKMSERYGFLLRGRCLVIAGETPGAAAGTGYATLKATRLSVFGLI